MKCIKDGISSGITELIFGDKMIIWGGGEPNRIGTRSIVVVQSKQMQPFFVLHHPLERVNKHAKIFELDGLS
jgi:hypothetical protein